MPKGKVIDGKLLSYTAIQRAMALRGRSITRFAIAQFFSGLNDPSLKTFVVMAEALGMSLDEMYDLLQRVRRGEYYEVGY